MLPVHDLVACVRAPTAVLSSAGGDIVADGAQGAFTADVRVLSEAVLAVGGQPLQPVQCVARRPERGDLRLGGSRLRDDDP